MQIAEYPLYTLRRRALGCSTVAAFDSGNLPTIANAIHDSSDAIAAADIRRITRGLYDLPRLNALTDKPTNPDPRRIIDALARRDQARRACIRSDGCQ